MKYIVQNPDGELTFDSLTHLRVMYEQGMVEPTDKVRAEDSQVWRVAAAMPELGPAVAEKTKDTTWSRFAVTCIVGLSAALMALFKWHSWIAAMVCMLPIMFMSQRAFVRSIQRRRE
jgi:hypothetical protein